MSYKWNNPQEWFQSYVERNKDNPVELFNLCLLLAGQLDSDTIQDLFQADMDADGYFQEEKVSSDSE